MIWFNLKLVSVCWCHGSREYFTKTRLSYDFSFKSIVTFFKSHNLLNFRDFLPNMQISNQIISKSKSWRYFFFCIFKKYTLKLTFYQNFKKKSTRDLYCIVSIKTRGVPCAYSGALYLFIWKVFSKEGRKIPKGQ